MYPPTTFSKNASAWIKKLYGHSCLRYSLFSDMQSNGFIGHIKCAWEHLLGEKALTKDDQVIIPVFRNWYLVGGRGNTLNC